MKTVYGCEGFLNEEGFVIEEILSNSDGTANSRNSLPGKPSCFISLAKAALTEGLNKDGVDQFGLLSWWADGSLHNKQKVAT